MGSIPGPRNFHMPWAWLKKKKRCLDQSSTQSKLSENISSFDDLQITPVVWRLALQGCFAIEPHARWESKSSCEHWVTLCYSICRVFHLGWSGREHERRGKLIALEIEMLRILCLGTSRTGESYPQVCSELPRTDFGTMEQFLIWAFLAPYSSS